MKCNETRCKQGIAIWSVLLISELLDYIACIGNGDGHLHDCQILQ